MTVDGAIFDLGDTLWITAEESKSNDEHRRTIIPDATITTLGELPTLLERWKT